MSLSIGIDGSMLDIDITGSYRYQRNGVPATIWNTTDFWVKVKCGRFRLVDVWNGRVFTANKHGLVEVPVDGYLERWVEQRPEDLSAVRLLKTRQRDYHLNMANKLSDEIARM
jgi:hypothetical protein